MGRVNEGFDRWFVDSLVAGQQNQIIAKYKKPEELEAVAANGGQEIRDWLAAAGAMPPAFESRVLAYEPLPSCGIGVMVWIKNEA
jgi:hypothetical protein